MGRPAGSRQRRSRSAGRACPQRRAASRTGAMPIGCGDSPSPGQAALPSPGVLPRAAGSSQTSSAWLGLKEMFTLSGAACFMWGARIKRNLQTPPRVWEGAEHPREELCLHTQGDQLRHHGSCPATSLRSPAARSPALSSLSDLIKPLPPLPRQQL